mmetsp:Transcript_9477/g.24153  ORF Transcript_9477/g.24153 Transcript_9477/m.24153 type:complete len:277 (-) Transcript_9477:170-1000(-)
MEGGRLDLLCHERLNIHHIQEIKNDAGTQHVGQEATIRHAGRRHVETEADCEEVEEVVEDLAHLVAQGFLHIEHRQRDQWGGDNNHQSRNTSRMRPKQRYVTSGTPADEMKQGMYPDVERDVFPAVDVQIVEVVPHVQARARALQEVYSRLALRQEHKNHDGIQGERGHAGDGEAEHLKPAARDNGSVTQQPFCGGRGAGWIDDKAGLRVDQTQRRVRKGENHDEDHADHLRQLDSPEPRRTPQPSAYPVRYVGWAGNTLWEQASPTRVPSARGES